MKIFKNKKLIFTLIVLVLIWQGVGLIPFSVKQLYPSSDTKEIATDQIFSFSKNKFSRLPGTITGCLYFPDLYNAKGERIQTILTSSANQIIGPDRNNNISLKPGEEVTLKVRAECGIVIGKGMVKIYSLTIYEKKYEVVNRTLTIDERLENSGLDPNIVKFLEGTEKAIKDAGGFIKSFIK
jgi:hypothetical protein